MAYSRYELPVSAFEHFPGLFSSIGMNVVESLPKLSQVSLFGPEEPDRKYRRTYLANVHGVDVKIDLSKSAFRGKTTAIVRLAPDGSIPPPELAHELDLAFDRIGAKVIVVERPFAQVLRDSKSVAKDLFDDFIRVNPQVNLLPEPEIEAVETAIRNRRDIRNRYRREMLSYLGCFVLSLLLIVLASEFETLGALLLPFLLFCFLFMSCLFVRGAIVGNQYVHWPCPRCGKRFRSCSSFEPDHNRCRYCGWEIPRHLR